MKKKKYLCIIFSIVFVAALCMTAQALEPLHSWRADDENGLKKELENYIKEYPQVLGTVHGYNERDGYHLRYKEVIWPEMIDTDFTLKSCMFAEVSWGSGADYFMFSYKKGWTEDNILVEIIYWYDDVNFGLEKYGAKPNKAIAEGIYNNIPYYAYESVRDDRSIGYYYNLIINDVLINVRDCEPFTESRIDLIKYNETEFILPVYAATNDYLIAQEKELFYKSIKPWLLYGIPTVILLGIAGLFIIMVKKKRNKNHG